PTVAAKAQPILGMTITDSRRNDAVRPHFLEFDDSLETGEPYAHMIFNRDLLAELDRQIDSLEIEVLRQSVLRAQPGARSVGIRLADGSTHSALLLIGADGARSRIRDALGIGTVGHDYGRSAIVATLAHTGDHEGRAVQHFLPTGPSAMLPLPGRRSSIVWTERTDDAAAILALPDDEFVGELERRFGYRLGALTLEDRPAAFPLRLRIARRFTGERVALLGDAARAVHPLAGQGLNLAFRDIGALVDSLATQSRLGLDIGDDAVLDDYQRARFFDSVTMAATMDGLHALFSNDVAALRLLRDLGLGLVNRSGPLKQSLISEAAGLRGQVPALLRGRLP
ncbi:MAG: 2-octaprenyl-6-methoxyphenyl hydroxylase, partial [Hyphomicrobiales bacterium]|nr:2-octaprenyl-6-methoxyphenyl hydroxylase [Hyphomicrobiales bacterium]